MSRIAKTPIELPSGVELKVQDGEVKVKGPKGELCFTARPEVKIELKDGSVLVTPQKKTKRTKAFLGLTRSLIFNMVEGVVSGYEKKLELQGVGYKVRLDADVLVLNVGFSHSVEIKKPENINFVVEKNIITISGIDKAHVGQIAAKIRAIRPPEPYKGKGIRYVGEIVRRKVGKKATGSTK